MFFHNSFYLASAKFAGHSPGAGSLRKIIARNVFTFIGIICLSVFLFAGCEQKDGSSGSLNGEWTDGYGTITVNSSAKTIVFADSYEGDIANSPDFTASNGVLIFKITKYWDADYSNYPDISYSENTVNINKYGALYWKELTAVSVIMADAYENYIHALCDDYESAKLKFLPELFSEYITMSLAPYIKK